MQPPNSVDYADADAVSTAVIVIARRLAGR